MCKKKKKNKYHGKLDVDLTEENVTQIKSGTMVNIGESARI